MKLQNIIQTIDENQNRIAAYGKFDETVLKKINYKLRLDWNYYSNRMEGGTLTREETRSVMVGNIDVKGKPFKDVAEMTGHDKIVLDVLKMSKGDLRISEKRIQDIHKAIMYEEDTEKVAEIGKWKTRPNEIINYKNEKISFTPPADVAEEVHQLLNKTNAELDKYFSGKPSTHALEIAAQFHIDFVSIHPFYDGNGRITRILTNILLMACGYPAIIIKDEHKKSYYQLLADIQAYGGKADLFYAFIGERILDTQKIILDALEGKDIEDPDDLDKELALLQKQLSAKPKLDKKATPDHIAAVFEHSLVPLFQMVEEKLAPLKHEFFDVERAITLNNMAPGPESSIGSLDRTWQTIMTDFWNKQPRKVESTLQGLIETSISFSLYYSYTLKGLRSVKETPDFSVRLEVFFNTYNYQIEKQVFSYDEQLTTNQIRELIKSPIQNIIEQIKTITQS